MTATKRAKYSDLKCVPDGFSPRVCSDDTSHHSIPLAGSLLADSVGSFPLSSNFR